MRTLQQSMWQDMATYGNPQFTPSGERKSTRIGVLWFPGERTQLEMLVRNKKSKHGRRKLREMVQAINRRRSAKAREMVPYMNASELLGR